MAVLGLMPSISCPSVDSRRNSSVSGIEFCAYPTDCCHNGEGWLLAVPSYCHIAISSSAQFAHPVTTCWNPNPGSQASLDHESMLLPPQVMCWLTCLVIWKPFRCQRRCIQDGEPQSHKVQYRSHVQHSSVGGRAMEWALRRTLPIMASPFWAHCGL